MPVELSAKIPKEVLLPIAFRWRHQKLRSDPDKWTDYEIQAIRAECGPAWAGVPIENVRLQCMTLRKNGRLGTLKQNSKNHGATKRSAKPEWYEDYLRSAHWLSFRKTVLEFWNYECAVCCSDDRLDVHHRHYETLNCENLNDCLPLCRPCHQAAHRRMDRRAANEEARLMFG